MRYDSYGDEVIDYNQEWNDMAAKRDAIEAAKAREMLANGAETITLDPEAYVQTDVYKRRKAAREAEKKAEAEQYIKNLALTFAADAMDKGRSGAPAYLAMTKQFRDQEKQDKQMDQLLKARQYANSLPDVKNTIQKDIMREETYIKPEYEKSFSQTPWNVPNKFDLLKGRIKNISDLYTNPEKRKEAEKAQKVYEVYNQWLEANPDYELQNKRLGFMDAPLQDKIKLDIYNELFPNNGIGFGNGAGILNTGSEKILTIQNLIDKAEKDKALLDKANKSEKGKVKIGKSIIDESIFDPYKATREVKTGKTKPVKLSPQDQLSEIRKMVKRKEREILGQDISKEEKITKLAGLDAYAQQQSDPILKAIKRLEKIVEEDRKIKNEGKKAGVKKYSEETAKLRAQAKYAKNDKDAEIKKRKYYLALGKSRGKEGEELAEFVRNPPKEDRL